MKRLFKKLVMYDALYPQLKKSGLYKLFKKVYGQVAARFHGSPSEGMFVIGVTGTNGKTTTVNVLHHLLNKHVGKTFAVSSAYFKFGESVVFNDRKMGSLDQFELQKMLVRARDE